MIKQIVEVQKEIKQIAKSIVENCNGIQEGVKANGYCLDGLVPVQSRQRRTDKTRHQALDNT